MDNIFVIMYINILCIMLFACILFIELFTMCNKKESEFIMTNDIYAIKAKTIDGSWWDLDINEITTGPCDNSDYTICRRIQGLAIISCEKSSENMCHIENNFQNSVNIPYTYYIYSENIIAVKIMRLNANE